MNGGAHIDAIYKYYSYDTINIKKSKYSMCGMCDHNISQCKNPTNRYGVLMTSTRQKLYFDKGFLAVEIKNIIGNTVMPESIDN